MVLYALKTLCGSIKFFGFSFNLVFTKTKSKITKKVVFGIYFHYITLYKYLMYYQILTSEGTLLTFWNYFIMRFLLSIEMLI